MLTATCAICDLRSAGFTQNVKRQKIRDSCEKNAHEQTSRSSGQQRIVKQPGFIRLFCAVCGKAFTCKNMTFTTKKGQPLLHRLNHSNMHERRRRCRPALPFFNLSISTFPDFLNYSEPYGKRPIINFKSFMIWNFPTIKEDSSVLFLFFPAIKYMTMKLAIRMVSHG